GILRLVREQVKGRATRFWRGKPIPRGRSEWRRREQREKFVSFRGHRFGFNSALQGMSNATGIGRKFNAVQVARSWQIDNEFLLHPARMRRKKQHAIAQTNRFTDVVGNENDGFAPRFPNALEIA